MIMQNELSGSANKTPTFVFAIPVISRTQAKSWPRIIELLTYTLQSLVHQTDPNWIAYIACQDQFEIPFPDKRIRLLWSPELPVEPVNRGSRDKLRKRRHIASVLRKSVHESVIVFGLDADDWVDKTLVSTSKAMCHDADLGLVIDSGYRIDMLSGYAEIVPKGFHRGCGSCFIGHYRTQDLPKDHRDIKAKYSRITSVKHSEQGNQAVKLGWTVNAIDWPAIAYPINHSESLHAIKNNGKIRTLKSRRKKLPPKALKDLLHNRFGIEPEIAQASLANVIKYRVTWIYDDTRQTLEKFRKKLVRKFAKLLYLPEGTNSIMRIKNRLYSVFIRNR